MSLIKTCAVIGGNGFIGQHLVNSLISNHQNSVSVSSPTVLVISRSASKSTKNDLVESKSEIDSLYAEKVRFIQLDMQDEKGIADAFAAAGVDTVFHLGVTVPNARSHDSEIVRLGNVTGAKSVVAACQSAKVSNLIYITGFMARPDRATDEQHKIPLFDTSFVDSTSEAEKIILAASSRSDSNDTSLGACTIRAPIIFGEGDKLTSDLVLGKLPGFPDFGHEFEFMYVKDLVRLIIPVTEKLAMKDELVMGHPIEIHGAHMTFATFFSFPEWESSQSDPSSNGSKNTVFKRPRMINLQFLRSLASFNTWSSRWLFGWCPLGTAMCPQILDSMAYHGKKTGGTKVFEVLQLSSKPNENRDEEPNAYGSDSVRAGIKNFIDMRKEKLINQK